MTFNHTFTTALVALRTNKIRSILTVLGIVIGITSIILIMSIGKGAENLIIGQISGMGAEAIVIRPGKEPSGPSDFADSLFSDSLKNKDIVALNKKSNVPYLVDIVPSVIISSSVSYQGETYRPSIFGWSAKFMSEVFDIYPEEGVLFDDIDIRQKASVVVIGAKVKEELFSGSDAIGKNIKIKGKNFRVVGVFPKRGQVAFFNVDEVVLLPYTSAQTYLLGIDYYHEIIVKAENVQAVDQTVKDIERTIRESHNIADSSKNDFYIQTQKGLVDQIGTIMGVLTAFLSMVVAISLIVGGIGVMNIMLVSVTERTKEIGLRKAIGATNKDIMNQFLLESVLLTVVGGIIGIIFGVVLSLGASIIMTKVLNTSWTFSFPVPAVLMGLGVAAFVGLVFGIYPARQASKKSPMEALRYE